MAVEPLWAPSFVDEEIWKQAVVKFHIFTELDRNVEKHLLPEMDEYLQSVFDRTLYVRSGAWGNPNERIGKSEKDIPIHCSPIPSKPSLSLQPQAFEGGNALRV